MKLLDDFKAWLSADEGMNEAYEAPKHDVFAPPFESLSSFLNFSAYDTETQLFKLDTKNNKKTENLGVAFVIELYPLTGADDETMDRLSSLISALPEEANLQIQMFGNPDMRNFLHNYEAIQRSRADDDPRKQVFATLAKYRTDFWKKGSSELLFANTTVRLRNFRCIIAVVLPKTSFDNRNSIDQAVNIKDRLVSTLRSDNLFYKCWDANDLIRWCALLLNPYRMFCDQDNSVEAKWNELDFLREQIIESHTAIKVLSSGSGIRFDNKTPEDAVIARCYSVKEYPEEFHLSSMGSLIGDAVQPNLNYTCPFLICMNLYKPAYDSKKNAIQLQSARATQMAESQMARILPDAKDRKQNMDLLLRSYQNAGGIVMLFHQLVLWDKPSMIEIAEGQAESIWKTRGFSLYRDQYMQLPSLLSVLPMALDKHVVEYSKKKKRWTTKTATNAIAFAPLIAEWSGNGPPVIGLFGTRGENMGIDLFTNPSGGYNAAVIGGTGSGKSFFVNEIVRNYLGCNARVYIIDVGRSYEKFCQLIGGQYVEFSEKSKIVIPPFQLVTNIAEDIQLLKLIFSLMCSPSEPLSDYQSTNLQRLIEEVWAEIGSNAQVDDLRTKLANAKISNSDERDFEMTRLGDQLFPYCKTGTYGRYFNGKSTLDFTDDLVVLELEELKNKPDLQQVIMQLIIYRIMQDMYLSRDRQKIVVIDEAWSLLGGSEATAKFIEEGYRRVRKYNGAFITATQSLNDYYSNASAKAALVNSDFMFHLRVKEDSVRTLEEKKPIEINSGVLQRIRALAKTDHYSEVYVNTTQGSGVGRLISDPFNVLVSSSKAEDFEAVRNYTEQGMNVAQAVEAVLKDRGVQHV